MSGRPAPPSPPGPTSDPTGPTSDPTGPTSDPTSGSASDLPPALRWLRDTERARTEAGLRRVLHPREHADPLLDLASNDYLGLTRDPRVLAGAADALRVWGAGSTGSRLVTGSTRLHADLEDDLAAFTGAGAALVFSSGYTANLAAVCALSGRGAVVVSDVAAHASLVDAARLSRARVVVAPCRDPEAVDAVLGASDESRRLVVTDGVDSVDGGLAPLAALHAVCRRRGAVLLVDDAHGLGVRGPADAPGAGLVAETGLAGVADVVVTATLSKSLGSQGGAVLAHAEVIAHLVDAARAFVFDTGLAPACVGAARSALRVVRAEPERVAALHAAAAAVAGSARAAAPGLGVADPTAAMVPVVLGEPAAALDAAAACARWGVRVGCFRPPSVPVGTSRLRLTARADLGPADLGRVDEVLRAVLEQAVSPRGRAPGDRHAR